MDVSEKIIQRYAGIVDDADALRECAKSFLPHSFRVNTIKASVKDVTERFSDYGIECRRLGFITEGFVTGDVGVGSTLEHFAGTAAGIRKTSVTR